MHKYVEIKQHVTEQPMGQRRNQRGNKKYLKTNENVNTAYQNLWDAAKVILTGKCTAINADVRKQEKSHINNLTLY